MRYAVTIERITDPERSVNMNTAWTIGFIAGILAVALVCIIAKKIITERGGKPGEYDERQLIVRGRAFTVAYAAIMIYLAVWLVLNAMDLPFFTNRHSVLLGLLLSVGIFAGYSIFNDAYFRTSDRPKTWIVLFAVVSLLNLGIGISRLARAGTMTDRVFENANLMTGVMTTAILVCVLIKQAMDRRGEGE